MTTTTAPAITVDISKKSTESIVDHLDRISKQCGRIPGISRHSPEVRQAHAEYVPTAAEIAAVTYGRETALRKLAKPIVKKKRAAP